MNRRSDGTTLISIYHLVCGFVNLLALCATASLPIIVGLASANDPDGANATAVVGLIALVIAGILVLIAAANFAVGWGLWRGREWARLGAIGLAVLRLINVPFGTIVGGLIIWHMLREEVHREFSA